MVNNFVGYEKNGIVLVNKPAGISSNKVVNIVKYALKAKKCGHLGTLDLEGEGLLPVTVNNATRLFDLFLKKDKTYEAVFVFGFETDTLDTSGEIIKTKECNITKPQIETAMKQMIGKYDQMPPSYSAKKINGKTAYKEARKGNMLELKPKEVEIYDFKLLEQLKENTFRVEISCSSGTYIRSICRDLAEKMSTYGSMQSILRTRCGGFMLSQAYSLEDVKNGNFEVVDCDKVFDYPKIILNETVGQKFLNGQKIKVEFKNGDYRLYFNGEFIGIGQVENKILQFKVRLVS